MKTPFVKIPMPSALFDKRYYTSDDDGDYPECQFDKNDWPAWLGDVVVLHGDTDVQGTDKDGVPDVNWPGDLKDKTLRGKINKKGGVVCRIPDAANDGVFLVWVGASVESIDKIMKDQEDTDNLSDWKDDIRYAIRGLIQRYGVERAKQVCDEAIVEETHEQ